MIRSLSRHLRRNLGWVVLLSLWTIGLTAFYAGMHS